MTLLGNVGGGMAIAFSILAILTVSNTLTTYITPSRSTLQEVIDSRTGLNTGAVVWFLFLKCPSWELLIIWLLPLAFPLASQFSSHLWTHWRTPSAVRT